MLVGGRPVHQVDKGGLRIDFSLNCDCIANMLYSRRRYDFPGETRDRGTGGPDVCLDGAVADDRGTGVSDGASAQDREAGCRAPRLTAWASASRGKAIPMRLSVATLARANCLLRLYEKEGIRAGASLPSGRHGAFGRQ